MMAHQAFSSQPYRDNALLDTMVDLEKLSENTIDVGFHRQDLLACCRNMRGH